ncbi:MAG: hypothetical protein QNK89_00815 [Lacinutrix sp.]|uniref:hypothetical protein n=1 Tax=Lacinutrix sp. TaxID=1937692 RepID=UPI00309BFC08
MNNFFFALLTITSLLAYGQKTEKKIINNNAIKCIIIEGDDIFKIDTKTAKTNLITLTTKIEGEGAQNTTIITEVKSDSLLISSIYKGYLKKNNDKLSAHKQLSIDVSIIIQEYNSKF